MTDFIFSASLAEPDLIERSGKFFQLGDYPDKKFSLNEAEADELIGAFQPVDLELEHLTSQGKPTIFDGKLGSIRKVWREGKDLHATTLVPPWVDGPWGENGRKISGVFDMETKRLVRAGLVMNPRVTDAVLMSAYAEFARHDTYEGQSVLQNIHDMAARSGAVCSKPATMSSEHEMSAMQQVHDKCVTHGATCNAVGNTSMYSEGGGKKMTLLEVLKNALGKRADEEVPASDVATFVQTEKTVPVTLAADPEKEALKKRVEALEADKVATFARFVTQQATAFANQMIREGKALPAEGPAIVVAFTQAANDDHASPAVVTFGEGKTGNRVDALKALYAARTAHALFGEVIADGFGEDAQALFNRAVGNKPGEEKPMDAKEKAKLMALTPLGREVTNGNGK